VVEDPTPFRTLADYAFFCHDVSSDHLLQLRTDVDRGHFVEAAPVFARFRAFLLQHQRVEETRLFPLLPEAAPGIAAVLAQLGRDHALIRVELEAMDRALEANDRQLFLRAFDRLGEVMAPHEALEERVLYPLLDRMAPSDERAGLLRQLGRPRE
jgi:hemerythrin superfamily protein